MNEGGKRILERALAHVRHCGKRGRPLQTVRKKIARQGAAARLIGEALLRGPKWGEMKEIEQRVHRKYGITRAEFYRIAAEVREWLPIASRLAAEKAMLEEHVTPQELERWRHRSADAVLRVAERRARRKKMFSLD